jgi:hypothetical protein
MKYRIKLSAVITVGIVVLLSAGCVSFPNFAVYDENIPENEQCLFIVAAYVTVTSFDGKQVMWGSASGVIIPAGEHHIGFSYYQRGSGVTSWGSGELTFNSIAYRKYALVSEVGGDYLIYRVSYYGVMPLAVPNTNETLVLFKKTGFGDYPSYVHIQGEDGGITFYLPRGEAMRFIIPNGSYTISGSKSQGGRRGKTLEIEARSDDITIDVIGPTVFRQPGIRLKSPE